MFTKGAVDPMIFKCWFVGLLKGSLRAAPTSQHYINMCRSLSFPSSQRKDEFRCVKWRLEIYSPPLGVFTEKYLDAKAGHCTKDQWRVPGVESDPEKGEQCSTIPRAKRRRRSKWINLTCSNFSPNNFPHFNFFRRTVCQRAVKHKTSMY